MVVKRWTLDMGTLLKYVKSGWYFLGMKNKHNRSNICKPFNDATPMNRKSPKSTGMGILDNIGAMKTDNPMRIIITIKMLLNIEQIIYILHKGLSLYYVRV